MLQNWTTSNSSNDFCLFDQLDPAVLLDANAFCAELVCTERSRRRFVSSSPFILILLSHFFFTSFHPDTQCTDPEPSQFRPRTQCFDTDPNVLTQNPVFCPRTQCFDPDPSVSTQNPVFRPRTQYCGPVNVGKSSLSSSSFDPIPSASTQNPVFRPRTQCWDPVYVARIQRSVSFVALQVCIRSKNRCRRVDEQRV